MIDDEDDNDDDDNDNDADDNDDDNDIHFEISQFKDQIYKYAIFMSSIVQKILNSYTKMYFPAKIVHVSIHSWRKH